MCNCWLKGTLKMEFLCEIIPFTALGIKYITLLYRRYDCVELINECRNIWNRCSASELPTVCIIEKRTRILYNFLFYSTVLINISYLATALYVKVPSVEHNGTTYHNLPYRRVILSCLHGYLSYPCLYH